MHISIRARGLLGSRNHEHRVKVPLLHGLDLSDAIREFLENRSVEVELRTMVTESCWVGIRVDMDLFWGVHCCLGIQLHVEFCDVGVHGENDSLFLPFAASNFTNAVGIDYFPLNSEMTTSSCVDESSFLQSSENVDQVNTSNRTFVKVHKSGSFGRSLDISKFSNYDELCSELARMFGLEGQLEDPQRSGWQLVFVDRENDVLLLGDDPWHKIILIINHQLDQRRVHH
ncbi:hypothetical protein ACOSQ2_002183 [Xanthoceras sorbifolium]